MSSTELLLALLQARESGTATPELVESGLDSPNPRCRAAAQGLAERHLLWAAPLLLRRGIVARDPLLLFESRHPERVGAPAPADAPALSAWFAPARVRQVLAAAAECEPGCLARLPGLWQLLACSPHSPLPPAARDELRAQYAAAERRRFPVQLSVVPSYACNRACAYCFSAGRASRFPGRIDRATLVRILDAVDPGRELVRISLFGGEPTLVPDFLALAEEARTRGLRIYFATNGVCPPERFRALVSLSNLEMVTLHVDPPQAYAPGAWERVLDSAGLLGERRLTTVIRYNLTDAERRDWAFLEPVLRRLPRAHVSFAVVFPCETQQNVHVPASALRGFAPKIASWVRWLAARRDPEVPIVLSKPFPPCAFAPEQLLELLARIDYHATCELHRRDCADQLQVQPNLTVSPCVALAAERYGLGELAPRVELGARCRARVASLWERPLWPGCAACPLRTSGTCQAACYAYAD